MASTKDTKGALDDKAAIRSYDKTYQSDDADLLLISSDDVVFKVHSYMLKAASSAFRDTLAIGTTSKSTDGTLPEMQLSDTSIEKATVVKSFLDIVYGGTPSTADLKVIETIGPISQLLKKYDCVRDLRTIGLLLRASVGTDISPDTAFSVAAVVDDVETCVCAIRKSGSWRWNKGDDEGNDFRLGVKGALWLDLTAAPLRIFDEIPSRYLVALGRASRKSKSLVPGAAEWDKVACEFGRLLGHLCERTFPIPSSKVALNRRRVLIAPPKST
ncbi:hypothetical protein P7C73_g892, partial [Tremellales sp. Uapishka_1]